MVLLVLGIFKGMIGLYYAVTTLSNYMLKGTDGLIRVDSSIKFTSCFWLGWVGGIIVTYATAFLALVGAIIAYGILQHETISELPFVTDNSFGGGFATAIASAIFGLIALCLTIPLFTVKPEPLFVPLLQKSRPTAVVVTVDKTAPLSQKDVSDSATAIKLGIVK
jgi:hypothetical protein